jgi:hypothetical protein
MREEAYRAGWAWGPVGAAGERRARLAHDEFSLTFGVIPAQANQRRRLYDPTA